MDAEAEKNTASGFDARAINLIFMEKDWTIERLFELMKFAQFIWGQLEELSEDEVERAKFAANRTYQLLRKEKSLCKSLERMIQLGVQFIIGEISNGAFRDSTRDSSFAEALALFQTCGAYDEFMRCVHEIEVGAKQNCRQNHKKLISALTSAIYDPFMLEGTSYFNHLKQCCSCKKLFDYSSKRKGAKYCNDRCRIRFHNPKRKPVIPAEPRALIKQRQEWRRRRCQRGSHSNTISS